MKIAKDSRVFNFAVVKYSDNNNTAFDSLMKHYRLVHNLTYRLQISLLNKYSYREINQPTVFVAPTYE